MSDRQHFTGLTALRREHLEHVREFLLFDDQRSACLILIMDDGAEFSYDLSVYHEPGCLYQKALEAIVTVHMLWSGQKFEFYQGQGGFTWRRI